MRRAPIYLLIDTSGSMHGEPIEAVKNGVKLCIQDLRNDPESMEKAYVSVITFASTAEMILPLTYIGDIREEDILKKLEAKGETAMGAALGKLNESLEKDLIKNSKETKGDYKAFVLILTDGGPTDRSVLESAINNIDRHKISYLVAATTDENTKDVLSRITKQEQNVIYLPSAAPETTFKRFFKWVSQSFSKSIEPGGENVGNGDLGELPPLPNFNDDDGDLL